MKIHVVTNPPCTIGELRGAIKDLPNDMVLITNDYNTDAEPQVVTCLGYHEEENTFLFTVNYG